jgi:YebC/PmpR family DNA-binding regulatory protein
MDAARTSNMPKENIKRVLRQAQDKLTDLVEITYEGFGPGGVGIIVEAATDNKNRTAQEVKYVFERNGGIMAGPGAVSYNFVKKGYMLVKKSADPQEQMLVLIDLGVLDVQDSSEGLDVYTVPTELFSVKQKIEDKGFMVLESEIIQEPLVPVKIESESDVQRIYKLLDALDNLDDVQKVFSSADFA